jgi:hypothetical protein
MRKLRPCSQSAIPAETYSSVPLIESFQNPWLVMALRKQFHQFTPVP